MPTDVRATINVETLSLAKPPAYNARVVLNNPASFTLLAIDLATHGWTATQAAVWAQQFVDAYRSQARESRQSTLPPTLAILGSGFTADEVRALRAAGCLVVDRSLESNSEAYDGMDLFKVVNDLAPPVRPAIEPLPLGVASEESLRELDEYPAGMNVERLDSFFHDLNAD
jgi:hypothetical protein